VGRIACLIALAALAAYGQRHGIENIDAEKPEGKLLQEIMQESDVPKRTALLEQFAQQFPKHEHAPWALENLQALYLKSGEPDKALSAGEKLLALDPDDPEAALQNLKAAEAKKDPGLTLKWSATTSANARKAASAPQPKEEDAVAAWKSEVEYARQVDQYSEYALYKAALESRDPKATVALLEALEQRNPKSEYLAKGADVLFTAYRQTNAPEKAVALAERTLAIEQNNEDMLLVVADSYLQNKKNTQKVPVYAARVVELMAQKPKPEGVSDADWTTRKNMVTGVARYLSGKQYYMDSQFAKADQELRAALPLVESNAALKPEVLYLLGFANYKLEKPQEAASFYRSCAAIKSVYQATAAKNLQGIRAQYQGIK
jgi:tetratricopeptide (TPR) repeat protein